MLSWGGGAVKVIYHPLSVKLKEALRPYSHGMDRSSINLSYSLRLGVHLRACSGILSTNITTGMICLQI